MDDLQLKPGPLRTRLLLALLWFLFYGSYTLLTPPLLDDADSVHSEVAREMLVRHDWITLYANGIRYLEKAPLLYWSMASSFKVFGVSAAAARLPLALTVLALAFALEAFARRAFANRAFSADDPAGIRAGLYSGLLLLSSFGIFIFTRIMIPDVMVCLWLSLAIVCYWLSEQTERPSSLVCYGFAACCALNVLTKGLIGIVFPIGIVALHLLATRGWRGALARLRQLHPLGSFVVFLLIAAPWHIAAGIANPTQGHPGEITFSHGHWIVPQPTDGNVHGWTWFYFVNEHLLRYLNLRVPRDYDTVPLVLFWGLLLVWMMPWSAFAFKALGMVPWKKTLRRQPLDGRQSTLVLLAIWAALPMVFFSFSTRQEYYVLPSLPALILLVSAWLSREAEEAESFEVPNRLVTAGQRISAVLLVAGIVGSFAAIFFLVYSKVPAPGTDLADLLQKNPGDYALSFGHFLDLNAQAMGAFRRPLGITAFSLLVAVTANFLLRRAYRPHAANLWLAGGTFGFLLAAHLGLQIFAPVLSSKQLADVIGPRLKPTDTVVIHGEYEAGSTLGFYLHRDDIHILDGRSSNLWYGSFFPDAPHIFESTASLNQLWHGKHRVFLWQDLSEPLPAIEGRKFLLARSGGKEILSNKPD
ncbi:MAG TPA: phospholipid carrier-dependent glycosyltransferase [Edaphobacter sp.]|nr:phospholipid carrier-dependent glycosyltransferase [Edaphobacter sp.]